METILMVLTQIEQGVELTWDALLHYFSFLLIIVFSIIIMFDDIDTLRAMESVKKKNLNSKVEERNEMFEAIAATKGHTDSKIWKRYLPIMVIGVLILILEEHLIHCNIISKILSICAFLITIIVKNRSNKNFARLKREKTQK